MLTVFDTNHRQSCSVRPEIDNSELNGWGQLPVTDASKTIYIVPVLYNVFTLRTGGSILRPQVTSGTQDLPVLSFICSFSLVAQMRRMLTKV